MRYLKIQNLFFFAFCFTKNNKSQEDTKKNNNLVLY